MNWTEEEVARKLKDNPDLQRSDPLLADSMAKARARVYEILKKRTSKVPQEKVDQLKESETDFGTWLEDMFRLYGWRFFHSRRARRKDGSWRTPLSGDKGFPDYFAVRGSRGLVVETKSERGKLTKDQDAWKEALSYTPIEYYLWRPSDRDWVKGVLK